jgi:formyltetrahydrofolate deformylase
MRIGFDSPRGLDEVRDVLNTQMESFQPLLGIRLASQRRRALIMVSKLDHCLVDLLYRWNLGELAIDIPVIVSNHPDCAPIAARYGIPFRHIPVAPDTKEAAESLLGELVEEHHVDFIVLARYMQILSPDFFEAMPGGIINIHHSFLPSFKGARPYHQAYERGVKLIGATAHYVTADLDEGPIIEQSVIRVTHAQSADDLVALARAVRLQSEDRVVLTGDRTVVFS